MENVISHLEISMVWGFLPLRSLEPLTLDFAAGMYYKHSEIIVLKLENEVARLDILGK